MTTIVDRLDDIGRPAWIALIVAGFMFFWPVGLLVLGYVLGSGRMGCWTDHRWSNQYGQDRWQRRMDRWQRRMARMQERAAQWCGPQNAAPRATGNHAFDEYRAETLRRLEDEQREFMEFLDRLRHAKDKAEFDQFMAERRRAAEGPSAPPPQY